MAHFDSIDQQRREMEKRYSYYMNNENSQIHDGPSTYWSYFKLRIIFSFLLLMILFSSYQTIGPKTQATVKSAISKISLEDPYTAPVIRPIRKKAEKIFKKK